MCLIQATRLPSRHVKFVCARLLEPYTGGMSMFEAEGVLLRERSVVIEDCSSVDPRREHFLLVVKRGIFSTSRNLLFAKNVFARVNFKQLTFSNGYVG